nr:L-idonate 5-dehydrogenase [uncultured Cohaesibacter sp.]
MKAVVCHGPKDIRIENTNVPEMSSREVLIKLEAGGICGSDLHYYNDGGFGDVRIKEPMILGHEVSGTILEVGSDVKTVKSGDLVAISPSRPCGECEYCRKAMYNHCMNMRFYGSAMPFPHIQGAFSQQLVALGSQCHLLPKGTDVYKAACAEPFSVALHAVRRAGSLIGKRVLVTGCGPIGALVVAAAKLHGALEVVVTDLVDEALEKAKLLGADDTVNIATQSDKMAAYGAGKGQFDVVIECSGSQAAMVSAYQVIRPAGILVQLGLGGDVTIPQNMIVSKEIEVRGAFRFHEEFAWAVELIGSGRIDLSPILTGTYPIDDAVSAFEAAKDRKKSMKVQLSFA